MTADLMKRCKSIQKMFVKDNVLNYDDLVQELNKNKHYQTETQRKYAVEYFISQGIKIDYSKKKNSFNLNENSKKKDSLDLNENDRNTLDSLVRDAKSNNSKISIDMLETLFSMTIIPKIKNYLISKDLYDSDSEIFSIPDLDEDTEPILSNIIDIEDEANLDIETYERNIDNHGHIEDKDEDEEESEPKLTGDPTMLDSVRQYLLEIGQYELLTKEEEIDLATKYKETGKIVYRNKLINHNLRLVVSIAKKYAVACTSMTIMDIVQCGNLGLMTAVEKFDPKLGFRFSTYASWWIKQSIIRSMSNDDRIIRLPVHAVEQGARIRRARAELKEKYDREPSIEDICNYMNENKLYTNSVTSLTEYDIRLYMMFYDNNNFISLDTPVQDSDGSKDTVVGDFIPANQPTPEELSIKSNSEEVILKLMREVLNEKEFEVICHRFGFSNGNMMTLDMIGKKYNVSRERIRQIEAKALRKLFRSHKSRIILRQLYNDS